MEPNLEFEWLIHYKCNYRCPYCFFEGMWEEVERRNVYKPVTEWLNAWVKVHKKYGYARLLITGGEPFIYPDFSELVEGLSGDFSIGFDTNLSSAKEVLADFVKRAPNSDISIAASFHPLFAKFDSFLDKALFLKNNNFKVCVQYVSYPEQLDKLTFYKNKFQENGLYFIPLPFRGRYKDKIYPAAFTEKEKRLVYNSAQNLVPEHQEKVEKLLNQVKSKERFCRAGQVYARVDCDGRVYRCGHAVSNSGTRPLGNIFDADFALAGSPKACKYELCPCESRWLVEAQVC